MEVSAEAKRIMVVALGKLYSSRSQRGGLRLHRSLLLTLVMKSARDIYHAAQTTPENEVSGFGEEQQHPAAQVNTVAAGAHVEPQGPASLATGQPRSLPEEEVAAPPTENKENQCPTSPTQQSRKRRGKAAAEPDFLPCKKAKLEQGNCPQQLIIVNSVLMDYVNCSSELGAPSTTVPLQRAIAAC